MKTLGKRIFEVTLYRAVELLSVFFIPEIVPYFKFKVKFKFHKTMKLSPFTKPFFSKFSYYFLYSL